MEKENIEGIYNYCDRWCERCTFTSRCEAYEDESELTPEELDMNNKAFWDRLGQNFSKAQDVLRKAAEYYGIDLENLPEESREKQRQRERIKRESHEHSLSTLSFHYSELARKWLKTQPGMLDHLDELKAELTVGVATEQVARKQTETIKDSLAVIQWYSTFIHVKLTRALTEKLSYNEEYEPENCQPRFNGSAKIALIAIARSMQAWSSLFAILPENEDEFLQILALLEKIKAVVQQEFPEALAFIRPGFDEES